MQPHMETPALAARGAPNSDLAGASINSESISSSLRRLQASRLARLYAVNAAMAETIAPLVFLEAMR